MHCPQCGMEVADDRSSCPACGAAFSDATGGGSDDTAQPDDPGGGQSSGQYDGQSSGQYDGQPTGQGTGQGGQPSGGAGGPAGQPAGQDGGPAGQPTTRAGEQPTQPNQPTQPSQPSQGPGQSGHGGGGGQAQYGGGGQHGGGQSGGGRGGGQQHQQQQQQYQQGYQQPQGSGTGLRDLYDAYLADLPIAGGVVAGVLVYIVGFVLTAAIGFVVVEAAGGTADLDIVSELFYNAHFTTLASGDPNVSRLPATLGMAFVIIPFMLFVTGARFGRWQSYEGIEVTEQVLAGAIVVAGYLPAVAIGTAFLTPGSDTFPPNYAGVLLFAGILYPVVCGGVGGLTSYFFGEFGGLRARTTGFLTGLLVLGLVYGVTFLSLDTTSESKPLLTALVSVFTYTAGHLFGIDGDGTWFMVVLVPLVLVAGVGFLRASRAGVDSWLDGVRAGGSIAFGYAAVTFVVLTLFGLLVDFPTEIAQALSNALSGASMTNPGTITIDPLAGPPNFLEWFVVIGILYPLVIGGGAGVAYVLVKQTVLSSSTDAAS